ncbi:hypothetical protein AN189_00595 [Loktanella sp. 3ANDIMAR09]|uniref:hypothetical protein n=1 Tax=Loktanella sp. 3ANDIMAR09 TaxID=1225657 RepID=UPI0006F31591|nr:hypothetical protein [Loktanella sp. 3ANDIMAR09]KQI69947.1 hypothetical protein AN189_00595 [Loktanella sp. 3ANDIMAR09]
MTLVRVVLFFLFCPSFAWAGTVLSGDHDGFTRVTVPVENINDWSLTRTETGYDLRVAAPLDLDLTRVFQRIRRDRVADVSTAGNVFSIKLACQCRATAFSFRDRFIVVDVTDESVPTPNRSGQDPFLPDAATTSELMLPITVGGPAIALDRGAIAAIAGPSIDLVGFERSLVETLAKASTRGVLTLTGAGGAQDAGTAPVMSATPDRPLQAAPGLVLRSARDVPEVAPPPDLCWSEDVFDVTMWYGDDVPFGARLAQARAVMTDGSDRFDPAAVEALARAYVYYGFGQEAIRTLELDGVQSRSRLALRTLAQVFDNIPPASETLRTQLNCPGMAPLWALAADSARPSPAEWDVNQIMQKFKTLPGHLQVLIAPRLAEGLRRIDAPDAAKLVLATGQKEALFTTEAAVVQTEILVADGDVDAARAMLFAGFSEDPNMPPDDVLRLLNMMLEDDDRVHDAMIGRLEDLIFANRNEPIANELRTALGLAYARNGDLPAALASLRAAATADGDEIMPAWTEVSKRIVETAADGSFLDFAFSGDALRPNAEVRNMIAARLLTMSLPERAAVLLAGPATGGAMGERRYLRAMAFMQMDDAAQAQIALAGIATSRAAAILAAEPWPPVEDEMDTAWRDGDWVQLSGTDDPLLQSAAILATRPPIAVDPLTPLSSGRALIADANEARATVDALLGRFQLPPPITQ